MARTNKKKPYHPYNKEDKENRHRTHVHYRMTVKTRMVHDDYDDIPPFKKTCGWNTY